MQFVATRTIRPSTCLHMPTAQCTVAAASTKSLRSHHHPTRVLPLPLLACRLNLGDYASSEQLEQIMGQLMQAYAPRRRPTARAFIEKLPRLPVAPAQPAGAGAGKSSTSGPAGQPQAPQSEQLLSQGQQPSTGAQASAAAASAAAAAPAASGDDAARYACCAAGDACPVCHEAYAALEQVVELPCQHCYHESCILPWLAEVRHLLKQESCRKGVVTHSKSCA